METRYGFREEVSIDMFSKNHSIVTNSEGRLVYESYYSYDYKYYKSDSLPINQLYNECTILGVFSIELFEGRVYELINILKR